VVRSVVGLKSPSLHADRLHQRLIPVSCSNADTVGEFVRGVWSSRFSLPD
jgi:hypothetical protein